MFQNLDERINYVATKVIHVGDQLESINTPRSRAVEVHKLMGYLEQFMTVGPLTIDIFNDPAKVIIFHYLHKFYLTMDVNLNKSKIKLFYCINVY